MNPTGKKFVSLFLVLSLLSINCSVHRIVSKEKSRGAILIITKKDGQQIDGELITVKQSSLLMADFSRLGVSIDITDIEKIVIIHKKTKAFLYGVTCPH